MIQTRSIQPLPSRLYAELGWDYFVSEEATHYMSQELVLISGKKCRDLAQVSNQAFDAWVEAAQYVLDHGLLDQMGIPDNLHRLIRYTWEKDQHLHLLGRFDIVGENQPVILEFNADTPTMLPETGILQWLQLKQNGLPERKQFNDVYSALVQQFKRLKELNADKVPAMLFSTLSGYAEDDNNVQFTMEAAAEAGFEVHFCPVEEVIFSEFDGIFAPQEHGDPVACPFWYKLIPWEFIGWDEPELAEILTRLVLKDRLIVINPAYSLLLQSKGLLPILHQLNPNAPFILPSFFEQPKAGKWVEKVLMGREGANVRLVDEYQSGTMIGPYGEQKTVFQAYTPLDQDAAGYYYQAGVFFSYEACGLGFRRSRNKILANDAQFVGHFQAT